MTSMIKAICFDFDGTLAEFMGDFATYSKQCFQRLGIDPGSEFLQTFNRHLRSEGYLTSVIAFERTCEETLMIGDNLEADIQGAINAGLQALHIWRAESGELNA
jgi:FMN phosphatase YigB (HAD superfamily)